MFILGLTGSIGMGKTSCADMFRRLGVPVHDADGSVHAALAPGGAAEGAVKSAFPTAISNGTIDRKKLGETVFADRTKLAVLEAILHPIAAASAERFLRHQARRGASLVVLDIPLLFETGGQNRVDAVLVVSAPAFLQAQRVLARPGMTPKKFEQIRASQMSDQEKRAKADFVVPTGVGKAYSFAAVAQLTALLRRARGDAWSASRRYPIPA